MTNFDPTLAIVRDQSNALIRKEISVHNERLLLEQAIRDAVNKVGKTVDSVSEASGLTPSEIRKLLNVGPTLEDELAALTGAIA